MMDNKNNKNDKVEGETKPAASKNGAMVSISKDEYEQLKQAAKEKEEYWDKFLRQQAEFENFRKRQEKEKLEFTKFANEAIILEMLEVLDNLERLVSLAEKHKEDFQSFLKGVEMILAHLYELLKKHAVKPIEAVGKKFDPLYHEVLLTVKSDTDEDNKIVEEFQKGYLLENRVIRTAKVKVAKSQGPDEQKTEGKS
jgi:molecular chaperone GrpE